MTEAKFTRGSIMRHITVMSLSSAAGITALFLVDLLDLYFLSLLGEEHLAAAVGFSGTVLFFTTSIGIGISIAAGALVSRAIGSENLSEARRYQTNVVLLALITSVIVASCSWFSVEWMLTLLGAQGAVHQLAVRYLDILIPSMPLITLAITLSAGLRAVGDAKLSMIAALVAGTVNAVLDPIFIFLLGWNIEGAAIASVAARFTLFLVSLYGVHHKHRLLERPGFRRFSSDLKNILALAIPAVGTNLAAPFSGAWAVYAISRYGDSYVAGYSIINRITPVAFGVIYALSGAIGPIIGQNMGARNPIRVRMTLIDALKFTFGYVALISAVLFLMRGQLVTLFGATGEAASLITFFCGWIAISFVFLGALFVTSAVFNNLGKPIYSTALNWGRATAGTIPVIAVASHYMGAYGVLVGQAAGSILFAVAAVMMARHTISKIEKKITRQDSIARILNKEEGDIPPTISPLSSGCSQAAQMATKSTYPS